MDSQEAKKGSLVPDEQLQRTPGFHVRIEDPESFFSALKAGHCGNVSNCLIVGEGKGRGINQIIVGVGGAQDTFALRADFFSKTLSESSEYLRDLWGSSIYKFYQKGNSGIVRCPNGTEFVVSMVHNNNLGRSFLRVITEVGEDMEGKRASIIKPPQLTPGGFQTGMSDFKRLIEDLVSAAFKHDHEAVPNETMLLDNPKPTEAKQANFEVSDELRGKIEVEKPDFPLEAIGGQRKAKREIAGLAFALKHPELYTKWGTNPPKGILFHGPPGTGKTLMAKALASEADALFFHVQATDVLTKWFGESEGLVKKVFELANSTGKKTIIFFDEIDALAPPRELLQDGSGGSQASHRVISALLENIDGLSSNPNVIVVASTNLLNGIDPALRRPGRFDRLVEVPLPDDEGRAEIIKVHMKKANRTAGRDLFQDIDYPRLVETTRDFSGADIAEIIRRTLEEKVRLEGTGETPNLVSSNDLIAQIECYEHVKK